MVLMDQFLWAVQAVIAEDCAGLTCTYEEGWDEDTDEQRNYLEIKLGEYCIEIRLWEDILVTRVFQQDWDTKDWVLTGYGGRFEIANPESLTRLVREINEVWPE